MQYYKRLGKQISRARIWLAEQALLFKIAFRGLSDRSMPAHISKHTHTMCVTLEGERGDFFPIPPPSLAHFPALHTAACISCDEKRQASNLPLKRGGDRPYWASRANETMCADGLRQEPQLYCHRTEEPQENATEGKEKAAGKTE